MKTYRNTCFVITIIFFSFVSLSAQDIGKIFSSAEADSLFGQVMLSKAIKATNLDSIITGAQDKVMFKIIDCEIYILDKDRNVLSPQNGSVDSTTVFHVFSKSKINELINLGNSMYCSMEIRTGAFTITNGMYTLELSSGCPPDCN
jgi:hypothetical protein